MQTYLVNHVAAYLSNELETEITVGGINVSFFFNVVLEDVSVKDLNGEQLVASRRMVFDIERISPRKRHLSINRLLLEDAYLGLNKYPEQETYNYQFIVDYFASEKPSDKKRWDVICKSLEFRESSFNLRDHNQYPRKTGFDQAMFGFNDFNLLMNDIFLENNTLGFELDHLSFAENGGFQLNYLSGSFEVNDRYARASDLQLRTPFSELQMHAGFNYEGYEALKNFFDEVEVALQVDAKKLNLADFGHFLPPIYGMEEVVAFRGELSGTPSNLRGNDFFFSMGWDSSLRGNFHLIGLPDFQETFINVAIDHMGTSVNDLTAIRLPVHSQMQYLELPLSFHNLGFISFQGRLTGFVNDMVAYGDLTTDIGSISSDIMISLENGGNPLTYNGELITAGFDLGRFFDREDLLGKVSMNAHVKGHGVSLEEMDVAISGRVNSLGLKDYQYQNMDIEGEVSNRKFIGSLLVDDPGVFLDFTGEVNFEEEIPIFDFTARMDQANLTRLNLFQKDSLHHAVISLDMAINARGSSLDDLEGEMNISDIVFQERPFRIIDNETDFIKTHTTRNISISNNIIHNGDKHLKLRSDFIDGDLYGKIYYDHLLKSFRSLLHSFVPAIFYEKPLIVENNNFQDLRFEVRFKDTQALSGLFFPSAEISAGAMIKGDFNSSAQEVNLEGSADTLSLFGNRLIEWGMSVGNQQEKLSIAIASRHLMLSDSLVIDQYQLQGNLFSDTLLFLTEWENLDTTRKNNGHIEGLAQFRDPWRIHMQLLPSYANINDSLWQVNTDNEIFVDSSRVEVSNLMIYKSNQTILADGVLSARPGKRMNLSFNNFDVSYLDVLLHGSNLNFAGTMDGTIAITAIYQPLGVEANLLVKKFAFNHDHLGDLEISSQWDNELGGFKVNTEIIYQGSIGSNKPIVASGYIYPDRKTDNFDLDINLENLRMSVFSRYLEGFATNFRGMASGKLRMDGPLSAPELQGELRLTRTGFRVDYLNTSYSFAHRVEVGKDFFHFDELMLNDTLGNSAMASGRIMHDNFSDFSLDILVQPEQMVLLNTTAARNELYYGRAFLTGIAHIHGPANDIVLDVSARTSRGTQIFLPLGYSGEITENNFITFVHPDAAMEPEVIPPSEISGLTLNFDLEITPDAEVQLIFDSQIGDIIRSRGAGDLNFEISSQGDFNMYGDYIIEEGDYLFTLQNIINKRFRVEQGGIIRWAGEPYDADIELRAAYRLRTALYDLVMEMDTSDVYRRRVPVETILILEDKLFNPSISFDIQFPGGDESTREMVDMLISTEQEMNRQVFSLLILNRFMPTAEYNTALGYGVGSTSSELLSNQLSNWLSQISSDFDIGVNYRPGDQISSQELEVALSTQLFDDRVIIDGNVGVAGNHPATTHRTSNIIGDVNVEVKITPEGKFRVKAFNRSNNFDVLNTNSPYTQGIGVFYRREFDSLMDLWKRRKQREEEPLLIIQDELIDFQEP